MGRISRWRVRRSGFQISWHRSNARMLCTVVKIDATEMERYGLVEFVVPRDRVHAEMDASCRTIANNGPLATRGTKRIVRLKEAAGSRAARELSDALRRRLNFRRTLMKALPRRGKEKTSIYGKIAVSVHQPRARQPAPTERFFRGCRRATGARRLLSCQAARA